MRIDLGKTTFHLVAWGERNKILLRRKFSRSQLMAYTANLPASLISLEACAGAHFMGTVLREQGHQVRLIPAQFVKPYRKTNKNDFRVIMPPAMIFASRFALNGSSRHARIMRWVFPSRPLNPAEPIV
jgi:transposase